MNGNEDFTDDRPPGAMTYIPHRQIRASFGARTIRVYQAYNDEIADSALRAGTFRAPPFKRERMTWIKPSFLWMMYRSGWGRKDAGQTRILAIDIERQGFEWALRHGCASHPEPGMTTEDWHHLKTNSPVRIQWDPERDLLLRPLPHRTIQLGIGGRAVDLYVNCWISSITDVTDLAHAVHGAVLASDFLRAELTLPVELPYSWLVSASPVGASPSGEVSGSGEQ